MTNDEISWETSATVHPAKLKRRTRANAPINYPIFRESSKFTDDPEWILFLNKAEKGIFPPGFLYQNETIFYNKNRNGIEDSKKITTIDPNEFFLEIKMVTFIPV